MRYKGPDGKNKSWTENSTKDFKYSLVSDFLDQVEPHLKEKDITLDSLAKKLNVKLETLEYIFERPDVAKLEGLIKISRLLGLKLGLVVYNDKDPDNFHGPVSGSIFNKVWEEAGSPSTLTHKGE